jgi:DNA-binding NarL/FixJ family response regulator
MLKNQEPIKILLVSDDQFTRLGVSALLDNNPQFTIAGFAKDQHDATPITQKLKPDVIILETDFEDTKVLDLIPALLQKCKAKIAILTKTKDNYLLDQAVMKGARGILQKNEHPDNLLKLVEKMHIGELWINREATSRIFMAIAQQNSPKELTAEQKLIQMLTKKEDKIVRVLHQNSEVPLKEVAKKLFISDHTLRNHLSSIYNKLSTKNRLELYVFCNIHLIDSTQYF